MIEEILKLRNEGLSFKKIASSLGVPAGRIQYQWNKHLKSLAEARQSTSPLGIEKTMGGRRTNDDQNNENPQHRNEYITAVLQNADTIFLCWAMSAAKKQAISYSLGVPLSSLKTYCRLYDITGVLFNGNNAHMYMDIRLPEQAYSWKLSGVKPERSYIIDIGYKESSGFIPVLRSESVQTPCIDFNHFGRPGQEAGCWIKWQEDKPGWNEHVSTYSLYEDNE
ncbi:hypothetical protein JOC77_002745 [Peribacillus deserti]|uniref:DUF4912 domain-containing protein n=1 Tax=Peribacillus deserti TaxID=673318 RepID=A0ABS2QJG4_9BACI|nr:DUF4912 domain-containing protein [Peribacillus deserti]MBM7693305.1 hypothetical protein [Peribacillus deserti]